MRVGSKAFLIRRAALAGVRPDDIANELGINPDYVRSAVSRLRRAGEPIPRHARGKDPTAISVRLGTGSETYRHLAREAAKRELAPQDLARRILATVCRDNLFTAVLE